MRESSPVYGFSLFATASTPTKKKQKKGNKNDVGIVRCLKFEVHMGSITDQVLYTDSPLFDLVIKGLQGVNLSIAI